jgi:ferredoxin-NADP reductase
VPTQATDLFKHFYPLEEYQKAQNVEHEKEGSSKGFIDQEDLEAHADKFASNIFDCGPEVSMAALQGFLLRYKKHPKRAMEEVETWAKGMKEEQDEKVKKREVRREERASRKAESESAGDQSPTQASE